MTAIYWLYNREMPAPGWDVRLRTWLMKHGCVSQSVSYEIECDRDEVVQTMHDDCVTHGYSARAFIEMAERNLGERRRAILDDAIALTKGAPRWNIWFFQNNFSTRIVEHMVTKRLRLDDLVLCDLSLDGGLRPIWRYKNDEVVLHDLCRFRIGLNGQGYTADETFVLANLRSAPGFAEWRRDAEELFGPLHEYFCGH